MKSMILKMVAVGFVVALTTGCQTAASVIEHSNARAELHKNDPEFKYMDPNWHYHAFPGDADYNYAQVIGN